MGCSPWGCKELDMTEGLHFHFSLAYIGEGNGNPLPCSCLENPRDGGAWWAAVCAVTQSRTRLKRLRAAVSLSLVCTLLCRDSFTQYIDCEIYPLFVLWIFIVIAVWRLQQYVNRKLPDVQPGFRKGRGTRDQIANIRWIMEKAREFQKNIYFCFIDYAKAFDCGSQ